MLKLSHVKKTFNKGTVTEKRALTGVDLTLNDGDFVTVIGGNGAGKSTLLNMIAGVYPLDSGVIELDGTDISRLSESQRAKYLGRVFQDPMRGTAADMQIAENLALAKRRGQHRGLSWGVTKAEKDEYVELLKRLDLGLDTRLNAKVGLLSGGQRQALTLLMATLTKPRLLLLDEHTAALDPKTASKVLNLTEEIVDENHLTTLMVTHNMNDAIRLGNRLIMMHEGHVIYDVAGNEKKSLTVADLLQKFEEVSGGELANDRMLLSCATEGCNYRAHAQRQDLCCKARWGRCTGRGPRAHQLRRKRTGADDNHHKLHGTGTFVVVFPPQQGGRHHQGPRPSDM